MIYLGCDKDQWRWRSKCIFYVVLRCSSEAVKWSPDIISRSAKWCKVEIRYSAIRQRVSGVRDRAKV